MATLERITTSFSKPGDSVVLLEAHPFKSDARTGSPKLVAAEHELASAAALLGRLDRRCEALPPLSAERSPVADAAVPTRRGQRHAAAHTLAIATVEPGQVIDQRIAAAWARLLRPGGLLAVLTHSDHRDGRLVDPTGQIVTAAQDADLLYLQHIVALQVPIRHGSFAPRPSGRRRTSAPCSRASMRHTRIHADVLVFAQAKGPTTTVVPEAS